MNINNIIIIICLLTQTLVAKKIKRSKPLVFITNCLETQIVSKLYISESTRKCETMKETL